MRLQFVFSQKQLLSAQLARQLLTQHLTEFFFRFYIFQARKKSLKDFHKDKIFVLVCRTESSVLKFF